MELLSERTEHLTDSLIEADEIISTTDRTPTGNMIGGDEHGSFWITTVASNEMVGTTGSHRAMKLGPRSTDSELMQGVMPRQAEAGARADCAALHTVQKTQQVRCPWRRKPVFSRRAIPKLVGFSTLMALPEEQVTEKIRGRILSGDQGMLVWWSIEAGVHVEPR